MHGGALARELIVLDGIDLTGICHRSIGEAVLGGKGEVMEVVW